MTDIGRIGEQQGRELPGVLRWAQPGEVPMGQGERRVPPECPGGLDEALVPLDASRGLEPPRPHLLEQRRKEGPAAQGGLEETEALTGFALEGEGRLDDLCRQGGRGGELARAVALPR